MWSQTHLAPTILFLVLRPYASATTKEKVQQPLVPQEEGVRCGGDRSAQSCNDCGNDDNCNGECMWTGSACKDREFDGYAFRRNSQCSEYDEDQKYGSTSNAITDCRNDPACFAVWDVYSSGGFRRYSRLCYYGSEQGIENNSWGARVYSKKVSCGGNRYARSCSDCGNYGNCDGECMWTGSACKATYVKFWEGNLPDGQDEVCKVELHGIGWTSYDKTKFEKIGCRNDEARSMEICHAKPGTKIWVFDNGNLNMKDGSFVSNTDDYTTFKVLKNITDCQEIKTFEPDKSDWIAYKKVGQTFKIDNGKVNVTRHRGGNLDGQVSGLKYDMPF